MLVLSKSIGTCGKPATEGAYEMVGVFGSDEIESATENSSDPLANILVDWFNGAKVVRTKLV
jgi:hypothetical protein